MQLCNLRDGSIVVALIPQDIGMHGDEIAVPWEEMALEEVFREHSKSQIKNITYNLVNPAGLINMNILQLIPSALGISKAKFRWLLKQADRCVEIALLLICGEVVPMW
jgi:hypothetical protein